MSHEPSRDRTGSPRALRGPWWPVLLVLTCASAVSAQGVTTPTPAEGSSDLFIPAPQSPDERQVRPGRTDVGLTRSRQVLLNLLPLAGADAPPGTAARDSARRVITLNLFADATVQAVLDHAEPRPHGMVWTGRVEGADWSNVTLVVDAGDLTGSVAWPLGAYAIRPSGGGRHTVSEVNRAAFPNDEPEAIPPAGPSAPAADAGAAADDGNTIDLMVVYTPAARNGAGGATAIQDLITLGVTETNQAYANSGVVQRLRLVHTAEVSYTESGDISADLDRVTGTSDGFMDNVHALRDTHGADMVKLVVDTNATAGGCGVAWLMGGVDASFGPNAFSVTERTCISPNYTFGHELGHNMGLNHARPDPTGTGAFTYSYGYKEPNNTFRTVMAYNCAGSGCPRVLQFSNPSVNYSGLPTGIVSTSPEAADNAKTLNNTRTTVANWRQSTGNTPGPATLVSPAGTVTTTTPAYTWNAVSNATDYQLVVTGPTGATLVQTWYTSAAVCSGATCSVTPATALVFGAHSWQILTSNSFGIGQWSAVGSFSVNASTLTVSTTSVPAGQTVQVTVDEGPGLARDWIGLFLTSATDKGYADWKYLNGSRTAPSAGSPSALVTFTMPSTTGTYNFRFFQNDTFTKLATSVTVTVTAATTPILEVTPAALAFGSVTTGTTSDKTVTVKNAGVGTLTGNATLTGTGYSLVGSTSYSLGPGQTMTLTVRFAPTTVGAANGTLTLTGASGATVPLTGTGVAPVPTLTVSATSVNPGSIVQVTVANGPGNPRDWVGLHAMSAADAVKVDWQYLNGSRTPPAAGSTSAILTFTMPTPGTYNFRLFQNDTYTKLATSATVTVLTPTPSLNVSSTSVGAGQTVQVTVANGPGYAKDWVALNSTAAADTGHVDWQYLNGTRSAPVTGLTSATLTFTMPSATGTYNFRFFQNNTYTKLATSPTVTVTAPTTPVIQVTPTSLAFGAVAVGSALDKTVTVKNVGAGTLTGDATVSGAAFSMVGPTTYSLDANQTATLTVRFSPAAGGSASGTLTLTGGGGATVALSGTGTASPSLGVSATTVTPGGTIQVTVSNGPGNARDWVALHATSAADTVYLDWKYLNGTRTAPPTGLTSATLTFTMPSTPGTYNFRLYQNNTYTKLTTSATVTVQVASTSISIVGATTVSPGATVQVSIQNGPANPKDWAAMHATSAADTVYLDWKYLNGTRTAPATGQSSATLTFTAPSTPGTYNFRFYQNNTYTKLATSQTLTVQ